MPETYKQIEARIHEAIAFLSDSDKPNLSAAATQFLVPYHRLCARWNGAHSYSTRPTNGKRLDNTQEAAVCQYLDRLDAIGTSARYHMVTSSTNFVLRLNHTNSSTTPPIVSKMWTK